MLAVRVERAVMNARLEMVMRMDLAMVRSIPGVAVATMAMETATAAKSLAAADYLAVMATRTSTALPAKDGGGDGDVISDGWGGRFAGGRVDGADAEGDDAVDSGGDGVGGGDGDGDTIWFSVHAPPHASEYEVDVAET
eukprot:3597535-Prymnesium_polylepis.3